MFEPVTGRMVEYHPSPDETVSWGTEPLAATICKVWSRDMVNLMIIDPNGNPLSRTSVYFVNWPESGKACPPKHLR
jgi:hypothetical protein